MAVDPAAIADSAPTDQAATALESGQAAASTDVTHGDAEAPTTTPDPAASEPTAETDSTEEPDEPDDPTTEPSEDDSPEEAKSKAERRRERRRAREQERIDRQVEERLAVKERERATEAETRQRTEAAQKAAQARQQRLAEFLGEPDAPDKPGTIRRLDQEIDGLVAQLESSDIWAKPGDEIDTLQKTLAGKRAERATLVRNNSMAGELESLVWDTFADDFASAAAFPELADPAVKAKYLHAQGGVRGGLAVLREAIRTAVVAEKDAEIKALTEKHATAIKAVEADRNAWRTRAGGAEVADTVSGGAPTPGDLTLTPERYAGMSFEQRQKLRSTPEGRAQIDRMARRGAA